MPSSGTASLVHLPCLNQQKKGLVVLLAALSMTISNIIYFAGLRGVWQVRIYVFAEPYS